MDIFVSAEKTAELEAKLDTILQNQQILFALMQDAGRLLMRHGKYAVSAGKTEPVMNNTPDPVEMSNHIDDRLQHLLFQYGETCKQIEAARILSVAPRTIARMLEEGRLRRIGTQVDVRSIYKYLEGSVSKGESAEKPVRKAKQTPTANPAPKTKMDELPVEGTPVEIHTGHSEFALASIGIRKENRAARNRTR